MTSSTGYCCSRHVTTVLGSPVGDACSGCIAASTKHLVKDAEQTQTAQRQGSAHVSTGGQTKSGAQGLVAVNTVAGVSHSRHSKAPGVQRTTADSTRADTPCFSMQGCICCTQGFLQIKQVLARPCMAARLGGCTQVPACGEKQHTTAAQTNPKPKQNHSSLLWQVLQGYKLECMGLRQALAAWRTCPSPLPCKTTCSGMPPPLTNRSQHRGRGTSCTRAHAPLASPRPAKGRSAEYTGPSAAQPRPCPSVNALVKPSRQLAFKAQITQHTGRQEARRTQRHGGHTTLAATPSRPTPPAAPRSADHQTSSPAPQQGVTTPSAAHAVWQNSLATGAC